MVQRENEEEMYECEKGNSRKNKISIQVTL